MPKVMHPGIQAANEGRGYIAPAQVELRKKARRELDLDIRNGGDLSDLYGDQYHPTDAGHGVVAAGLAPYYVTGGTIPSPLAARVYAESEALE